MKLKLTYPNVLLLTAVLTVASGIVVFAAGYAYRGENILDLAWAALTMLAMGALTAFMHRFRLTAWLTITFLGYIVGLVSALQLLMIPNVTGGYAVAVLTVVTFTGHGLVIGMFTEFIVWLHRVTHGLLDYAVKGGARTKPEPEGNEKVRLPENRE